MLGIGGKGAARIGRQEHGRWQRKKKKCQRSEREREMDDGKKIRRVGVWESGKERKRGGKRQK